MSFGVRSSSDGSPLATNARLEAGRIGRCGPRALGLALFVLAAHAAASEQEPAPLPSRPKPKVSERLLVRLVAELDDPSYAVRDAATRRLLGLGMPAVPFLANGAERGSLETVTRAVAILETIYLTGDDDASDAAETALERLASSSHRSAAARATRALVSNQSFRQRRALERIVELGGVVKGPLGERIDINDPTALGTQIPILQLGTSWKGGDAGLRHVKRLTNLNILYVIDGSGVSDQGIADVRRALPQLRSIERRGAAYLGVGGETYEDECKITSVRAGSAAHRAGIRPRDVLLEFDGKPLKDFPSLIKMISAMKPGQKVRVVVRREGERKEFDVTLDTWE